MVTELQVVEDVHVVDDIGGRGLLPGCIGFVGLGHTSCPCEHTGTEGIDLTQTAVTGITDQCR